MKLICGRTHFVSGFCVFLRTGPDLARLTPSRHSRRSLMATACLREWLSYSAPSNDHGR